MPDRVHCIHLLHTVRTTGGYRESSKGVAAKQLFQQRLEIRDMLKWDNCGLPHTIPGWQEKYRQKALNATASNKDRESEDVTHPG
ncbi:MAG TPA: hypothetical protein PKK74_00145 [Candidatus Methanoculleus thermohydrogenotrophicum]|nr:hypothetical protein [Candidatus Methanoculleus thermohydrogenotrophicum]HOB17096.1 hypothetical protein [Candidatus Methanoculleus thermohydrogenotrophicum]HPZ37176.1 hypothetical protein [Candidatus Methanoculleus thermohydrogenotrophicum]HQC90609.1 hypothetical protein [Candidatus Methanoculleus thermohydrogenotrophicum]